MGVRDVGAGSEAQNRTISDWLLSIDRGTVRLPSFQRGVAWDPQRVQSMLNTIVHDLPLGVALVLTVGDHEQFVSRALHTAPSTTEKVTEHLLDGQQRLTALYRALRDNDDKVTYFLHFPDLDDDPRNDDHDISVWSYRRWERRGARYPRWIDDPRDCLRRGLIPVRLLDPSTESIAPWVEDATRHLEPGDDISDIVELRAALAEVNQTRNQLKDRLARVRETVRHFNLPYLRLPASTSRQTALSVFVNMNTNAKPLSAYDIVVAELESATGLRLRELLHDLDTDQPRLRRYLPLDTAVLQTSALLQGRPPSQRGFFDMDPRILADNWERMTRGLQRAVETLASLRIVDGERLPSAVPLPVVAALLADAPEHGDDRARVDRLVRRYLWRSFFSDRYEAAAASRAAADHRALAIVLAGGQADVPILDADLYPLPTTEELKVAGWPRSKATRARAVLAASTYFGARDLADDTTVTDENVGRREYHHVFPHQLLVDAGLPSMLALNCALITWKTNRSIGRLDPLTYLRHRSEAAPDPRDVEERLESHLVPYHSIASAGPYEQPKGQSLREAVEPDFVSFLDDRAAMVHRFMLAVCDGQQPHLRDVVDPS